MSLTDEEIRLACQDDRLFKEYMMRNQLTMGQDIQKLQKDVTGLMWWTRVTRFIAGTSFAGFIAYVFKKVGG